MPVQPECYNGHSWEEEVSLIKNKLGFEEELLLGYSRDYNRPLVLLTKYGIAERSKNKIVMDSKRALNPSLLDKIISHL